MNYNVIVSADFDKDPKSLVKKYPSLKTEYAELYKSLEINPAQGTPLGKNCFKIRLAIRSKAVGKSGGARVITHVKIIRQTVNLLSIYDKSGQATISAKELEARIKNIS
jgi:hypothetical protein